MSIEKRLQKIEDEFNRQLQQEEGAVRIKSILVRRSGLELTPKLVAEAERQHKARLQEEGTYDERRICIIDVAGELGLREGACNTVKGS
jgi:hypothetical protein